MQTEPKRLLMRRFPYLEKAIEDRFVASPEFRSLCADYVDATEALTRLEDSLDPTVHSRIAEYRRLVRNLEAEILVELYREIDS
jgi:hypothetical protein